MEDQNNAPAQAANIELLPPGSTQSSSSNGAEIREIAETNAVRQMIMAGLKAEIANAPTRPSQELIELALKVADSIDANAAARARIRISEKSNDNATNHLALVRAYLSSPLANVVNPAIPALQEIPVFSPPAAVTDVNFNPAEFAEQRRENYEEFSKRMAAKTPK